MIRYALLSFYGNTDTHAQDQITDEHVIQSMTPATLIDLTRQQVKQTHLFHEYAVLRREWLRAKLDKALLIATNATQAPKLNNLWHARESLFVQVRVAAPLVVRLLKELFLLPTRHLRAAHLHHYTTWLDKRAMLLIHYVSGLMARQPLMTHLTDPSLIKRIRTDLELLHDVDYSLILARAEMISPGIYVTLTGDPGDIEEKIVSVAACTRPALFVSLTNFICRSDCSRASNYAGHWL